MRDAGRESTVISPTRKGAARRPCFHMVGAEPPAPGSPGPPHSVFLPTLCLCSRPPCPPIPEHLLAGVRASPSQPLALSLTAQTSLAQHSTHQLKAHCLFRAGDSGTQPPLGVPQRLLTTPAIFSKSADISLRTGCFGTAHCSFLIRVGTFL